jgi:hypothetical protein
VKLAVEFTYDLFSRQAEPEQVLIVHEEISAFFVHHIYGIARRLYYGAINFFQPPMIGGCFFEFRKLKHQLIVRHFILHEGFL